ncbi:MAG: alpha/beta fold hydrolase [Acidimicrobiales bacterium]
MIRPIGISKSPPPRIEGTITLGDGRRLGYAEFGDPKGSLVLWFHGSPGARRQVPPSAREAAGELGLRIVCVERPGVGYSTDHRYARFIEWAADVAEVADNLGHDTFMVVGLSGGGPYALACAHELPERVVAVGLLGSLVPTAGDDATAEGLVTLARRLNGVFSPLRRPLGLMLWGFMRSVNPLSHLIVQGFARAMPEGDRRVLGDPELEAMFVDDLTEGSRRQFGAFVNDMLLVGRPWGFRLGDVKVPVRWWHGDSDPFVPLDQAERAAEKLPDVKLEVRKGESHLGDFAAAGEVLGVLASIWNANSSTRSQPKLAGTRETVPSRS